MFFGLSMAAIGGCGSSSTLETAETPRRSNISVMRTLVGEISAELNSRFGNSLSDTVILHVDSSASAWIVRSEISALLSAGGRRVLTVGEPAPGRVRWAVRGVRLEVSYSDIRKPGIFSEALLDRVVRAEFTSEISNSREIFDSYTSSREVRDTVIENEVASLENGEMGFTKGTVPDLDTWDRFIEPFVVIGAAGTAIFLFFQVRS
jgi:hypothetical protein